MSLLVLVTHGKSIYMVAYLVSLETREISSLFNTNKYHKGKDTPRHISVEIHPANTSTLNVNTHQRCFKVAIWLEMKVELTYIYQRCFNIGKTTLKQNR